MKFNIEHRAGTKIPHVDCLSRNPVLGILMITGISVAEDESFIKKQRADADFKEIFKKFDAASETVKSKILLKNLCGEWEYKINTWESFVLKSDKKLYHRKAKGSKIRFLKPKIDTS